MEVAGDNEGMARSPSERTWKLVPIPEVLVRDARSAGRWRPRGRRARALVTAGGRGVGGALRALRRRYLVLEPHFRGGWVWGGSDGGPGGRSGLEDARGVASHWVPRCTLVARYANPAAASRGRLTWRRRSHPETLVP